MKWVVDELLLKNEKQMADVCRLKERHKLLILHLNVPRSTLWARVFARERRLIRQKKLLEKLRATYD